MKESLIHKQEADSQEQIGESYKNNHEYNHSKVSNEELKNQQKERLDEARQGAESISLNSDQTLDKIKEMSSSKESLDQTPKMVGKELKKVGLQKELSHIRRKMSKADQIGSKVIHNKEVRVVSEGLSRTIVRPSGMLGGAILALIGTSLYYYFTKTIGVKYNYFVYIILFVGGFVLGIIIELIIRLFKRNQNLNV